MIKSRIFVALIHHPVYDKNRARITTSVTNFDIHDISRTCRTYGVEKYFIIHPNESQRFFTERIIRHWREGYGSVYNKTRYEAFSIIELASNIEEMVEFIQKKYHQTPSLIATSARKQGHTISYQAMRNIFCKKDDSYVILLGTGWGLPKEILDDCQYILDPIQENSDYNHLSVRAAAAIILDRLLAAD